MMKKINLRANIAIILGLIIAASAVASPAMPDITLFGNNVGKKLRDLKINLGLDLRGGAHLVYRADMSQIQSENVDDSLSGARDVIERRVNAFGIAEPQITTNKSGDEYRIIVDLAGVTDINSAISLIGETPTLDFREEKGQEEYALTPEEKEAAISQNKQKESQAKELLARTLAGEDFAQLAQESSEDPGSGMQGGDLDFFKKGMMVPEFEEVAFNEGFQVGSVWPELVKTQFGYHILKKTDQRGEGEDREVRVSHILLQTASEEYRQEQEQYPFKMTNLTGKNLERAEVVFDPNTNEPQVSLQFDAEGTELFRDITERNIGKRVAIFLDGSPITVPTVQTAILDGRAVITGSGTVAEAQELAKQLNAGALPVPVTLISQEKVGAILGAVSLKESLTAGALGFLLTALFMIIFYRLPGVVADLALAMYAVFMVAIFKILGITLTLSGIAGFILSVGMAVDGNILIFERLKEELRLGQSLESAMKNAFQRAWPSIRDGNASTLITCAILAGLGTGMIKGFAITLGIGVALSMFTAVFVTKNIMYLLVSVLKDKAILGLRVKKVIIQEKQ